MTIYIIATVAYLAFACVLGWLLEEAADPSRATRRRHRRWDRSLREYSRRSRYWHGR